MRTNESFCYEPDKLAEGLVGVLDIDEGFVVGCVGGDSEKMGLSFHQPVVRK